MTAATHSTATDYDILVVGGGMVGATAALALADQGWSVALVESSSAEALSRQAGAVSGVNDVEPRVSALSLASRKLLTNLGVWQLLDPQHHCPYQRMVVWDGEGTGRIAFDSAEMHAESLGTIVENRVLLRAIYEALKAGTVELLDNTSVSGWWEEGDQRGIIIGDQQRLSASLVIAADGPKSRLRQWAGLPTRSWDYEQQAIVCTVETSQPHQSTAWQRFAITGPLAFLPLAHGDGHYSSIVWSQDTAEARRLMALDDADFRQELERAIEQQLGAIKAISPRFSFPLQQRYAKAYTRPGLALIGDAAHAIHPLAGQGVNLGYSDVRVLAEELQRAKQAGIRPDEPALLARYQRRRKGENLAMMGAMEGFKQLFARDELPLRWLRNTGMRWLNQSSLLKNRIAAEAMGIER